MLAEEREARTAARASDWALVCSGVGVGEDEDRLVVAETAVVEEGVVVVGDVDDGAVDVVAGSDDIFMFWESSCQVGALGMLLLSSWIAPLQLSKSIT